MNKIRIKIIANLQYCCLWQELFSVESDPEWPDSQSDTEADISDTCTNTTNTDMSNTDAQVEHGNRMQIIYHFHC